MGIFDKAKDMAAQAAAAAQDAAVQKAYEMKAEHEAAAEQKAMEKAAAKELAKGNKVIAKLSGNDGTMILKTKSLEFKAKDNDMAGEYLLQDIESARVETGAELQSRVTMTRLLLLNVFAFAVKKKKGGERYVTVDGKDFVLAMEVSQKHANEAMKFATKINNAVKQAM